MDDKIEQLEYTLMELGTEVFRLKSKMSEMQDQQATFNRIFTELREIIGAKGVITSADFEEMELEQDSEFEEGFEAAGGYLQKANSKSELH